MRLALLSITILITACATPPPTSQPAPSGAHPSAQITNPARPTPAPRISEQDLEASPEEPMEEIDLGRSSDLASAISNWIADNPRAEFEEAARMANRFMRRYGYPLVLDVAKLLKPGRSELRLKSGKRTFVFKAGEELSRSEDVCGERFLRIPGRILGPERAALVSEGREYPFSLKGFRRDRFRIFRKGKIISTLFAPEPTEPIGLTQNGKSIYIKFPLHEKKTAGWWQRIGLHQPSILDEDPFLTLRVERGRLYFVENIEHLPPQEFEVEQSEGSAFRWRFKPSELVLELSSHCL